MKSTKRFFERRNNLLLFLLLEIIAESQKPTKPTKLTIEQQTFNENYKKTFVLLEKQTT